MTLYKSKIFGIPALPSWSHLEPVCAVAIGQHVEFPLAQWRQSSAVKSWPFTPVFIAPNTLNKFIKMKHNQWKTTTWTCTGMIRTSWNNRKHLWEKIEMYLRWIFILAPCATCNCRGGWACDLYCSHYRTGQKRFSQVGSADRGFLVCRLDIVCQAAATN